MVDKRTILQDLKSSLQGEWQNSVRDIVMFGSQTNGKSNENSDYDILIILNNDYSAKDENKIYDLCYDIDLKYNIIIDAHLISVRELETLRGKQPIYTMALKSGIYA